MSMGVFSSSKAQHIHCLRRRRGILLYGPTQGTAQNPSALQNKLYLVLWDTTVQSLKSVLPKSKRNMCACTYSYMRAHANIHSNTCWDLNYLGLSLYLSLQDDQPPLSLLSTLRRRELEQKFYNQLEESSTGKRQRPSIIRNLSLILVLHSVYQTKVALLAPITARLEHWTSQWLELVVASGIPQKEKKKHISQTLKSELT